MIAIRNWFPHGCAAPNGCDNPRCRMCNTAASAFAEDAIRADTKATRDGAPRLAAERPRENLAFRKRHREGPNYVPRHSRV